jgi:hypothetical protein
VCIISDIAAGDFYFERNHEVVFIYPIVFYSVFRRDIRIQELFNINKIFRDRCVSDVFLR